MANAILALLQALEGVAAIGSGEAALDVARSFDETYTDYVGTLDGLPPGDVLERLQALDAALSKLANENDGDSWSDHAVQHDPRWQEIRGLAARLATELRTPTLH